MQTSIVINVPRAKVWDVMLADATYREWTSVFHPGSYFIGDWSEGSKMLFIGPGEDGKSEGGMVSRIKENRLHEYLSIEHLGIIANGVEDTTSAEAKKWSPAYENYTFTDVEGGTEVSIDMDIEKEYKEMMEKIWPEALRLLKTIAERP